MSIEEIKVSGLILGGLDFPSTYTPPAGSTVDIIHFEGDASYAKSTIIKLLWGATLIWTIEGNSKMPFVHTLTPSETNGVTQLSVNLDNQEATSVFLSAYLKMKVDV